MIIIDVETGGLNPRNDALLSIGAIDFDTLNTFSINLRPQPDKVVNDQALEINGFRREDLDKFEFPHVGLEWFLGWLNMGKSDYTIAGENPAFDRDFLDQAFKDAGLKNPFGHRTVDLHSLAYSHIIGRNEPGLLGTIERKNKLNADVISTYVGLPAEPRPHLALNGAKWECEAFGRLIYGRNTLVDFAGYEIPIYLRRPPIFINKVEFSRCTCRDGFTVVCPIHYASRDNTGPSFQQFGLS